MKVIYNVSIILPLFISFSTQANADDQPDGHIRQRYIVCAEVDKGLLPENYRCASDAKLANLINENGTISEQTLAKSICHGEFDKKETNFNPFKDAPPPACDRWSKGVVNRKGWSLGGWTERETCPPAGGANPRVSGSYFCGSHPYTITSDHAPEDGNNCGYSWFTVSCFEDLP